MAVYYKFKSAKDFDSVTLDGHFISIFNLKEKIVEQKKLGRGVDFDLVISNAQTAEEYTDDGYLVPKNTSVVVRRVPSRPSLTIVADAPVVDRNGKDQSKSSADAAPLEKVCIKTESAHPNSASDALDEFGLDLYAVPEVLQARRSQVSEDEDNLIKAFVDSSANDWQRQTQEGIAAGRGYGSRGQGRGLPPRAYGRGFEKKAPPQGYVCHRCNVTGHFIQHCPTNGDPTYDLKKVKPPTGIPKTMLVANPGGSYALPSGEVAVMKPNEAAFDREVDCLPTSSRPAVDVPKEFCCPLCMGVLKDAVLTSRCCFKSFCDKCIRDELGSKGKCLCGARVVADGLLPNMTFRVAIANFIESQTSGAATSSDRESAQRIWSKMTTPALSISLKEPSSVVVASDASDVKEQLGRREDVQGQVELLTKKVSHRVGAVDADQEDRIVDGSPESHITKEPVLEIESTERPSKGDTDLRELPLAEAAPTAQGRVTSELVKGKKKPRGKRLRQVDIPYSEGGWGPVPGPAHNYGVQVPQGEYSCVNCGGYDHPTWGCYMNGPGPSHPPPIQGHGPVFGPGFNPQIGMMMQQPMPPDFMVPYPNHLGYHGYVPYDQHFLGHMGPPPEAFGPPAVMLPFEPPGPREFFEEPTPMGRHEFEARKAEMKRRREREQRFGREHVKYSSSEPDMGAGRFNGWVGERFTSPSGRMPAEGAYDLPGDCGLAAIPQRNGEGVRPVRAKIFREREGWVERDEAQPSSEVIGQRQLGRHGNKLHEGWGSSNVDEAASGDEIEARYSRGEGAYSLKHKERVHTLKTNNDSSPTPSGARSGQRRPASSGYDSEEHVDTRRQPGKSQSRSISSHLRSDQGNAVSVEQLNRDVVEAGNDNSVPRAKDGKRTSVFERTNLPIKPKRIANEDSDGKGYGELRVKRIRGSHVREQVDERMDGLEDGRWQQSGNASRRHRRMEDL